MAEADTSAAPPEQTEQELRQEVEKLREENKQLRERVEEQDKEIAGLKEKVQKQEEDENRAKRRSSFGKGRFARKPRKKQSEGDEGGQAAAEQPAEGAPTETGDQADTNSPDKKTTPSKKKATIRGRLGRAFGRFRSPKGGYEQPQESEVASPTSPGVIVPERKSLTWTVARSFQRQPHGETAEDVVLPADVAEYVPFKEWNNEAVREWLTDLELPQYTPHCVWTGEEILKATDEQFEKELGVQNPIHRKKLRLTLNAIASGVELPPELLNIDVRAVAEWLDYNGVPAIIVETFVECSIDGRVLTFLSMDDLAHMKVNTIFMQATIKRGIQLLRKNGYRRSYMTPFEEPEPEAEPEPEVAADGAPPANVRENKVIEDGTAGDEEAKLDGEAGKENTEAGKKPDTSADEEKRRAEAAKQRQRRRYEQLAVALISQKPVETWSNAEVMVWVRSLELEDNVNRLRDTGVTGALMVLDPCFTAESLCSALNISAKSQAQHEIVHTKLPELLGEEAMGQKDEASKLEGYCALSPTARPKKKRSLSFSGALRRKAKGEKTTTVPTSSSYVCSLEVHMTEELIEAHTKDCSAPPPPAAAPVEEPALVADGEEHEGKPNLDDEADHETVPLVDQAAEDEEVRKPQTLAEAAAAAVPKATDEVAENQEKPEESEPVKCEESQEAGGEKTKEGDEVEG